MAQTQSLTIGVNKVSNPSFEDITDLGGTSPYAKTNVTSSYDTASKPPFSSYAFKAQRSAAADAYWFMALPGVTGATVNGKKVVVSFWAKADTQQVMYGSSPALQDNGSGHYVGPDGAPSLTIPTTWTRFILVWTLGGSAFTAGDGMHVVLRPLTDVGSNNIYYDLVEMHIGTASADSRQISALLNGSLTVKLNTADLKLDNPSIMPAIGDQVTLATPPWTGYVTGVETADPVDKGGHVFVSVTATNTFAALASAAPFNLSDAPSPPTSYGYSGLSIKRTFNEDGTTKVQGVCTIYQDGLWPAMTFLLTSANQGYSAASFSVANVTVTYFGGKPIYRVEFGDPLVTMEVWLNNRIDQEVFPITTTKITDGAITTPKLAANAVTADKLIAVLVLASLIRGGAGVAHTEMDAAGFRAYDASGNLVVNVPTDGNPVSLLAKVVASSLVVPGSAVLAGTSEVGLSASMQLDSSQGDPTQAPSIAQSWDSVDLPLESTVDGTSSKRFGLSYSAAGGAGGATKVFWMVALNSSNNRWYIVECLASNRTVNRYIDFALATDVTVYGVCQMGATLYVLLQSVGNWIVYRYTASTLAVIDSINISIPVTPANFPSICTDGSNIYIVDSVAAGAMYWYKYDAAMVPLTFVSTGYNPPIRPTSCAAGNFDFGAFRIVTADIAGNVRSFDSAGANQANEGFEFPGQGIRNGVTYGDALGDGARFWTQGEGFTFLTKHSNWVWTTASALYWAAYSWYDSNATGGTHETLVSPKTSITMGRRRQLTITAPSIPGGGGSDDPNSIRFYLLPNASSPGVGAMKQQASQVAQSVLLTSYNSGGAADPASNSFVAGTPAILKSQLAGFTYKGSGLRNYVGTSFPSGAVTNDHYWRSDLGLEFFYDGTRWLSVQAFLFEIAMNQSSTVNTSIASPAPALPVAGGSDWWLLDFIHQSLVSGTNNGSNYWTINLQKYNISNIATLIDNSMNTSADGANWVTHKVALNALLFNGTTFYVFSLQDNKVGAPGTIFINAYLTARLVAT